MDSDRGYEHPSSINHQLQTINRFRPTPGNQGCDSFPGDQLPCCIISSAPVSEAGGPGASPGEAAIFSIPTKIKHPKK